MNSNYVLVKFVVYYQSSKYGNKRIWVYLQNNSTHKQCKLTINNFITLTINTHGYLKEDAC